MKLRSILASKKFRLTIVIVAGVSMIYLAGEWRLDVRHQAAADELERMGVTVTAAKIDWTMQRIPEPIRKWMPRSLRETHRVTSVGLQNAVIDHEHFQEFLPHLNGLRRVHTVYLSRPGITDETLRQLVAELPRVREIWAFGTSVTVEAVKELQEAHPKLNIVVANN
jgi:hypothetical protein